MRGFFGGIALFILLAVLPLWLAAKILEFAFPFWWKTNDHVLVPFALLALALWAVFHKGLTLIDRGLTAQLEDWARGHGARVEGSGDVWFCTLYNGSRVIGQFGGRSKDEAIRRARSWLLKEWPKTLPHK
jgi:hypothetical protein